MLSYESDEAKNAYYRFSVTGNPVNRAQPVLSDFIWAAASGGLSQEVAERLGQAGVLIFR